MAAAGTPVAKFSNLFGQADLWDSPDVAMNHMCAAFGAASTADRDEARTAVLNFATRSPTVLAITLTIQRLHDLSAMRQNMHGAKNL